MTEAEKHEREALRFYALRIERVYEREGQFWIEPGESLEDALTRFEREETGLTKGEKG